MGANQPICANYKNSSQDRRISIRRTEVDVGQIYNKPPATTFLILFFRKITPTLYRRANDPLPPRSSIRSVAALSPDTAAATGVMPAVGVPRGRRASDLAMVSTADQGRATRNSAVGGTLTAAGSHDLRHRRRFFSRESAALHPPS
jgi:hypothetical protein